MKNRDISWRRYKKHCTEDNDTSLPFKVGTLGPHTVLPIAISCPMGFSWLSWSEISSFKKMILVLGEARSHRAPNLGCHGGESPGLFDVSPKNSAWEVMHKWVLCCDEAANHQLPTGEAFWIIQIASLEECSSLTQNLMQIHFATCSVIFNVTATQYTCSLHSVYRPHWLAQWRHHCSRMQIPVHSPWLPGYTGIMQTILVLLTMAGLFLDRPHIYIFPLMINRLKIIHCSNINKSKQLDAT